VQVREPAGQRGSGAAFFASLFAAKERRELAHMGMLNLFFVVRCFELRFNLTVFMKHPD